MCQCDSIMWKDVMNRLKEATFQMKIYQIYNDLDILIDFVEQLFLLVINKKIAVLWLSVKNLNILMFEDLLI